MPYLLLTLSIACVACSDDGVESDEAARRAYLGLDKSIEKSLNLGFQGFNLASSANIAPQQMPGNTDGMLIVSGQVDQGNSDNKGMRLSIAMAAYTDGPVVINDDGDTIDIVYDTATDVANQPYLNLKLNDVPTGTLEGTLDTNSTMTGVYVLSGGIEGELRLDLTIRGMLMAGTGTEVLRVPGSTTVTGTATNSDGGVFDINIML